MRLEQRPEGAADAAGPSLQEEEESQKVGGVWDVQGTPKRPVWLSLRSGGERGGR